MDFELASAVLIDAFAEAVIVHADGVDMPLLGAWRAAYQGENAAGLPIEREHHEFLTWRASWESLNVVEGDTITRGESTYRIVDIQRQQDRAVLVKCERAA